MEQDRKYLRLKETFSEFFQNNLKLIVDTFISEGDFNWSVKHSFDRIFDQKSDQVMEEALSGHTLVLSEDLWMEIKDKECVFVENIKNQAQDRGQSPFDIFRNISTLSGEDYKFLKEESLFVKENQSLIKAVDYVVAVFYTLEAGSGYISGLSGNAESLYVYRSISTKDSAKLIKDLISGTSDRGLGVSWSTSLTKARSYLGEQSEEVLHVKLHGLIPLESIDLLMTIVKNISGFSSENEFYLKEKETVNVYKFEIYDRDYNLLKSYDLETPFSHHT